MNREIKFDVLVNGKHFGYEQINSFGEWEFTCSELNPKNFIRWSSGVLKCTECIRRQFTGILDKNGKEIYEGDILLYPNDTAPCVVVFQNACFITDDMLKSVSSLGDILPECKIIGNIYQNQELLK